MKMSCLWNCFSANKKREKEKKAKEKEKEEQEQENKSKKKEEELEDCIPGPSSPFPSEVLYPGFSFEESSEDPQARTNMKEELFDFYRAHTFEHIPVLSLAGQKRYVKVTKVLDGNTIEIVLRTKISIQKHRVRLIGIDSPRVRPRMDMPSRELHQKAAILIVRFLEQLLLKTSENILWIEFSNQIDKYGKCPAEIFTERSIVEEKEKEKEKEQGKEISSFLERISINKLLLSYQFVKMQNPETRKQEWTESELLFIIKQLDPDLSGTPAPTPTPTPRGVFTFEDKTLSFFPELVPDTTSAQAQSPAPAPAPVPITMEIETDSLPFGVGLGPATSPASPSKVMWTVQTGGEFNFRRTTT